MCSATALFILFAPIFEGSLEGPPLLQPIFADGA